MAPDWAERTTPNTQAGRTARGPRLTGESLLVLQLLVCGYSPDQIADLRGVPAAVVLHDLGDALAALGMITGRDAEREARQRGLIVWVASGRRGCPPGPRPCAGGFSAASSASSRAVSAVSRAASAT